MAKKIDNFIINKLNEELKGLNPEDFKNTRIRLKAILRCKKKQGTLKDIGDDFNVDRTTVSNWNKLYDNKGIEGVKNIEDKPISKPLRDTSKDQELLQELKRELKELKAENPDKFLNTIIRAEAVKLNLEGKSQKNIAKILNLAQTSIGNWVKLYADEKMEGLKKLNGLPPTQNTRETSNDKELLKELIQEFKELKANNPDNFNNTKQRAKAIGLYLQGGKTQQEIGDKFGVNASTISEWLILYADEKMEGLKKLEKMPLTKNVRDTSNDKELYKELKREFKELKAESPNEFPRTLERAKALGLYLKGGKTQKEVAKKFKVIPRDISKWLKIYDESKMEGLKALEIKENIEKLPITNPDFRTKNSHIRARENTSLFSKDSLTDKDKMDAMTQAQYTKTAKRSRGEDKENIPPGKKVKKGTVQGKSI